MIKIGIDARAASSRRRGGLNTYTANLIKGLATVDQDNRYILYTDREFEERSLVDAANFSFKIVRPTARLFRENLTLPYHMCQDRLDTAHFPINAAPLFYPGAYVITVHDTSTREHDMWCELDLRGQARLRYEAYLTPRFVQRASLVVTDSNCSKASILQSFSVRPEKVRVVYPAAGTNPSAEFSGQAEQSDLRPVKDERFMLALGSSSPRKNLRSLVRAFVYLREEYALDYLLVIVTSDGATKEQLIRSRSETRHTEQIMVLPKVDNATLQTLYHAAELFVCPSLHEGFGMPILEAMAFGTPVLSSDRTSLPEVVGGAGLLVDPLDIQQMAQQMYRLLTDNGLRHWCITRGLQRCREFSWEETARQMLAIYEEALDL
jgi:glycosyltransferase involved in cell wall biosynthesis